MNRQRLILLGILVFVFLSMSVWIVIDEVRTRTDTFLTGTQTQDIQDVTVPKVLDASQLHPPALLQTDFVRYGSVTSSAAVIEYGDFQCPDCRAMSPILDKVIASYNGKIRFVWHDLPVQDQHPNAMDAAIFARCAGFQGKFWEAYDELMRTEKFDTLTLLGISDRLKLDPAQLGGCQNDSALKQAIQHEIDLTKSDGISKAPTIFVGTKAFIGPLSEQQLRTEIDSFLKE